MDLLQQLITDYTLRNVALGSAVLGMVAGTLGSFALLRQQSLLGDAVSHAALPGVVIAYMLTGSKAPLVLILGAALAGWVATGLVMLTVANTRIKYDSALGIVLSVFFGFGLVLLTFLQKTPDANQAGLDTFLFGQAAALVHRDVITMSIVGGISIVLIIVFWKEFKMLSFDSDFGKSLGFNMRFADILLTALIVIAIVIGLQTVGVVLMSAMIIAPAAAARQWTNRLSGMIALSALFGAVAGVAGATISSVQSNLPTGPVVVLGAGVIVTVSILFAPARGVVWTWIRQWRNGKRLRMEAVMVDLFTLAAHHHRADYPHDEAVINMMTNITGRSLKTLEALEDRGLATRLGPSQWALTDAGVARVRSILETSGA
ncbi:MAG: metal ABC transporter permease [Rhodothermales bacterium]|nr:metal ABC transporter permease [Rhodothermales bacterium]